MSAEAKVKPAPIPLTPIDRIRIASAELRAALMALPSEHELEHDVDELIRASRAEQAAVINANACGTRYDQRKADAAEEALADAREKFIAKWGGR